MGENQSKQPFGPRVPQVPDDDNRERMVCPECGYIRYDNPKIVAGAVITWDRQYLLCRRAIHPRKGYWTIPAGYLELNETALDGALREVAEEACAEVSVDGLLAIYNIPRISQVQLIYRAELIDGKFAPGVESLETALFAWEDIPWGELAFPSVHWSLRHHREVMGESVFQPRTNPDGDWGDY
jgi:ADP-ribose pyrophosphatase YjhB (NUDIX family)